MTERPHYYILIDKVVTPALDIYEWARAFDHEMRRVAFDKIDDREISTVFLGLDHNFSDEGPAIVFETMIFGPHGAEEYQTRCATWDEAFKMHRAACALVRAKLTP